VVASIRAFHAFSAAVGGHILRLKRPISPRAPPSCATGWKRNTAPAHSSSNATSATSHYSGRLQAPHGPVSVLINNAARDDRHTLDALSVEKWDQSIAINLRPHFFTAQAVIPALVATPSAAGGYEIVVDCLPTCLGVNRVQELPISIAAVSSSLSCSIQSSMARSGLPSPGTAVSDSGIERPSRADSHVAAAFKVG
jgi:NAD(P)-dependent dehydrogenase (short-subunit alcohol dehydrogenase family)